MEQIIKTWCPKCGKANFNNNGDPQDLTGVDIEAIRCWSCKNCYPLDPDCNDWKLMYFSGDKPPTKEQEMKWLEAHADDGKESC